MRRDRRAISTPAGMTYPAAGRAEPSREGAQPGSLERRRDHRETGQAGMAARRQPAPSYSAGKSGIRIRARRIIGMVRGAATPTDGGWGVGLQLGEARPESRTCPPHTNQPQSCYSPRARDTGTRPAGRTTIPPGYRPEKIPDPGTPGPMVASRAANHLPVDFEKKSVNI